MADLNKAFQPLNKTDTSKRVRPGTTEQSYGYGIEIAGRILPQIDHTPLKTLPMPPANRVHYNTMDQIDTRSAEMQKLRKQIDNSMTYGTRGSKPNLPERW